MIRFRLIREWRRAWRMHSVQILAAIAMLPLIWDELPAETKALIPEGWQAYVVSALAVIGVIGRLRDQTK